MTIMGDIERLIHHLSSKWRLSQSLGCLDSPQRGSQSSTGLVVNPPHLRLPLHHPLGPGDPSLSHEAARSRILTLATFWIPQPTSRDCNLAHAADTRTFSRSCGFMRESRDISPEINRLLYRTSEFLAVKGFDYIAVCMVFIGLHDVRRCFGAREYNDRDTF